MSRGLGLPIQRYREPRLEVNTVYASRIIVKDVPWMLRLAKPSLPLDSRGKKVGF